MAFTAQPEDMFCEIVKELVSRLGFRVTVSSKFTKLLLEYSALRSGSQGVPTGLVSCEKGEAALLF